MEYDVTKLKGLAISETGVLFDPTTGNTYTMNRVASLLLKGLQQGEELDSVAAHLIAQFDVDPDHLHRDIDEFIAQMKYLHLI